MIRTVHFKLCTSSMLWMAIATGLHAQHQLLHRFKQKLTIKQAKTCTTLLSSHALLDGEWSWHMREQSMLAQIETRRWQTPLKQGEVAITQWVHLLFQCDFMSPLWHRFQCDFMSSLWYRRTSLTTFLYPSRFALVVPRTSPSYFHTCSVTCSVVREIERGVRKIGRKGTDLWP